MYKDWYFIIDREKNKYKKLIRIFGIPFSDDGWQDLFKVEYVALTKVKMVKINRSVRTIGNETSSKLEMFAVFIYGRKKA